MSLIKKTIVLSSGGAKGYINVIRLGNSAGAKIALTAPHPDGLSIGIVIGGNPQENFRLTGDKTEVNLKAEINSSDAVSAVVIEKDGRVYAAGGNVRAVNIKHIIADINNTVDLVGEAENTDKLHKKDAENADSEVQNEKNDDEAIETGAHSESYEDTDGGAYAEELSTTNNSDTEAEDVMDKTNVTEDTENKIIDAQDVDSDVGVKSKANKNPFDLPSGENFYQSVRARLEELFTINPPEKELESLIPDSRFAMIKYDGDDYYVVGVLTENGVVTHVAYGVPGVESVKPPEEAAELCDFLPLPNGNGYWLMFQKSTDGTLVKIE